MFSLIKISNVFQPRTDVRVRVRRIVSAVRVRNTAVRVRVVVRPINHTTIGGLRPSGRKCNIFIISYSFFYSFNAFFYFDFPKMIQRFVASLPLCALETHALRTRNQRLTLSLESLCTQQRFARRQFCRGRPAANRCSRTCSTNR